MVLALAVASLSCAGQGVTAPVEVTTEGLHVDLGTFTVHPGDTETCFSTGYITDRDYPIGVAMGTQSRGGHHIAVYWTNDPTQFAPRPCTNEDMLTWNYVAAAGAEAGGGGDDQSPPEGLAFRLPAGAQIVVQAHYINTTDTDQVVHDTVDIEVRPSAGVRSYADLFSLNDGTFEIPPHTRYRRVTECTVTAPRSLVLLLGHMHEHGLRFASELTRAGTTTSEMLYDEMWTGNYVTHPPVRRWDTSAPLMLQPGDVIRQTCEWENIESDSLMFPSEMCAMAAYYFPEVGEGAIDCGEHTVVFSGSF